MKFQLVSMRQRYTG